MEAIAAHAPRARLERVDGTTHTLTSTHADAVAALIADLADRGA